MNCLLCNVEKKISFSIKGLFLGQTEELVCQSCFEKFSQIGETRCPICSRAMPEEKICEDCFAWQKKLPAIKMQHHSLYRYDEAMAEYFQRYKFDGDYRLRVVFQKEISNALSLFADYFIVPLPISEERNRSRGFNQVEGLFLAKLFQALEKKQDTQMQSHKTRLERLQSPQPFSITANAQEKIRGQQVLLVDDIYTTGRTLMHAYDLIQQCSPAKIESFSLAR